MTRHAFLKVIPDEKVLFLPHVHHSKQNKLTDTHTFSLNNYCIKKDVDPSKLFSLNTNLRKKDKPFNTFFHFLSLRVSFLNPNKKEYIWKFGPVFPQLQD